MVGGHDLVWRRSPHCRSHSCVEIAITEDLVYMRDSAMPDGPWLTFTRDEWVAFLRGLKQPPAPAG